MLLVENLKIYMWVTLHTYVYFYWRVLRSRKFRTVLQPLTALLAFCLVGIHSKSEVREELEKQVPYFLAGKPGALVTGSLQW